MPDGIVASGFPEVHRVCRQFGVRFDPWQVQLNQLLLGRTAAGSYAADTVVLSIPRQVGKTFDIGAVVFALCIIEPRITVVWTAHRFKVARLTFNEMRGLAKLPGLSRLVDYEHITTAAGNERIPFVNGSEIVFAARERGAIRGFPLVRVVVMDEAQYLTDAQLADLVPTTNQSSDPLIVIMGTPPKPSDPGEAFTMLRAEALAGEAKGVLYAEFSADADCDSDDEAAWRAANPSFPRRTPRAAILRMRKLLTPEDFRREALGIWDGDGACSIFGTGRWEACYTAEEPPRVSAVGVAVSIDQLWCSLGSAGVWPDGRLHVGASDRRAGVGWAVAESVRIQLEYGCLLVIDERGPACDLIEAIEEAGGTVTRAKLADYLDACAGLFKRVQEGTVTHAATLDLDEAVARASWRPVGERRAFSRRADVAMLEAVALAAQFAGADYDLMASFG